MNNESDLIRIFTGTEMLVNLLKDELEQVGITALVQNDFQSGISAGFFGGGFSAVDLFIQEADLKEAEPIVAAFNQNNISC